MISSPNRSRRSGKPIRLVAIHTAEGALNVTALGNYFAKASVQASSHVGIDDRNIETYVPYTEAAWTMRSANSIADQAELCGFAAWTRVQWLGDHRPMLERTAAWIRERCLARDIPIRKLTPAQVGAGQAGVCGHHDWTVGMKDGTHTDPGPGFPWDVVMALASGTPAPSPIPRPVEDDMPTPAEMWDYKIPDPFDGSMKPARDLVGWAATHAAFARGDAKAAKDGLTALAQQMAAIKTQPAAASSGPAVLSEADVARIATAVLDLFAKRTAS